MDRDTNRQVVLDFYELGLVRKRVAEAFERYVAEEFVEHKPDVSGGDRSGAVACLKGLVEAMPQGRWELVHSIAEGEYVVLQAKFFPTPDADPYAIARPRRYPH